MIASQKLWLGTSNTWLFIALVAILYIVLYPLINRTHIIKSLFLNPKRVEDKIQKSALSAFYSEKLYKIKDKNGILIYISVLERKVWILADTNINAMIPQQEWDTIVDKLTTGIKKGHARRNYL
jgi:putative membrane protein